MPTLAARHPGPTQQMVRMRGCAPKRSAVRTCIVVCARVAFSVERCEWVYGLSLWKIWVPVCSGASRAGRKPLCILAVT